MLRYSRHIHVEAEGRTVRIVRTGHYQGDTECESSVLYQHIMLGAQNEFQSWLEQQYSTRPGSTLLDRTTLGPQIIRIATKWTKDLSTEVLLMLAADDPTLVENRGDWAANVSAVEIIRASLRADILSTLWLGTCRTLQAKSE